MTIITSRNWSEYFLTHHANDLGNKNMKGFTDDFHADTTDDTKMVALVEEIDIIILASNHTDSITIFHSAKNLGGTCSRKTDMVICLTGLGPEAMCVLLDEKSAIRECKIKNPSTPDLRACTTSDTMGDVACPAEVTFTSSAVFLPA